MIRCPDCQHANPDDSAFCASCGASLTSGEQTLVHEAVAEPVELTAEQRELVAGVPVGIGVLVIERGATAGSRYLLDADTVTLGRHPSSDVLLDDITVSRRHASVTREDSSYRLTDVGSLNGTYVNHALVDDVLLRSGDTVQVGRFHFVFLVGTGAA